MPIQDIKRRTYQSIGLNFPLSKIVGVLFLLVILLFTHQSFSQNKLNISAKDTTLASIFDQIRSQSEIDFIYNDEVLEQYTQISVSIRNATIDEVLEQCLYNTKLTYKKINQAIIIIPYTEAPKTENANKVIYGKLKGTIIDGDSKIPLPGATVLALSKDGMRAVSSDENGYFKFNTIPVGRHSVRVSYIGYDENILSEIFVGSSREVQISVALHEKIDSLGEISVGVSKGIPMNDMAIVSSKSFSVEETKRYAASISDPARMALVFAGVTGNDDATNEIVIRGNSPNWMQWRLEGVEIPSPNHFSEEGYTSGSVSILSSDMLATSDFYMGAFPAEFGNALSGVFDLRLRNGNNEQHEFSAQAGILGFDFSAEGPLKKGYKGSYLANVRYSSLGLLDKVNIHVSENALPSYEDLSFKFNLPTKKWGSFSLWAIGGKSKVEEEYLPDNESEQIVTGYSDFVKTGMYAMGITHTFFPDQNSYVRTVLSNSYKYSAAVYEILNRNNERQLQLEDELQNDAITFTTLYNRKISNALTFRTGLTVNNNGYSYQSNLADEDGNLKTFMNGFGRTNLMESYIQGKYRISDRLTTTLGMHYAYFELSKDHSLEPRLGISLQLDQQQKLTFGFGRHSKNEDLPLYFVVTEDPEGNHYYPNIGLKMTKANHFILGYEKQFDNDVQIKTEVYFQKINNLPVPSNPNKYWPPMFANIYNDTLANMGQARNMGIELTIQKYFTNNYYLLFTSSLFDAKYKLINGKWYNSKFNSNYASNFVGGKEFDWGDNKLFGINAKVIWYGGKRILPLDLDASIQSGVAEYDVANIFTKKGPDYFRIDLGFNLHFFREKSEHIISLDIQNTTNRRNIFSEEYNPITKDIDYYYLTGFLPILQYRIEF